MIKDFFGVRGNLAKFERYLFRETGDFFSLPPAFEFKAPCFLRPPKPWDLFRENAEAGLEGQDSRRSGAEPITAGSGRFTVEAKFRNIKTPEFREEQERFFDRGKVAAVNDVPPALSGGCPPDFSGLEEDEKNYFFKWRDAFRDGMAGGKTGGRDGATRQASPGCVSLYCRELILLMGGLTPEAAFAELARLYETWGSTFPELRERFPQWLLDFAIIHNCPGQLKAEPGPPLILTDLYLHRKYIEENNIL